MLEIGPGQSVLSIMAAIMGAKVTVVDLPQEYLKRYRKVFGIFEEAIKAGGGELNIMEGDINDPAVKGRLPDSFFTHIFC